MKKTKKLLSLILTLAMVASLLSALPLAASAAGETHEVRNADELAVALAALQDGDIVKLLADIDYDRGTVILITGKTVTFDVNGHILNLYNTIKAYTPALDILDVLEVCNGGELKLTDSIGGGELNVNSTPGFYGQHAVYAHHNGKATVSNVTGSRGAEAFYNSSITVNGDVAISGSSELGVKAQYNGNVTVHGDVSAIGYSNRGVYSDYNSIVTIHGNVAVSGDRSIGAEANGASLIVKGSVAAAGTDCMGVYGNIDGVLEVEHDVIAEGANSIGVYSYRSMITIGGTLSCATFIKIDRDVRTMFDYSISADGEPDSEKPGYYEYRNSNSYYWWSAAVWVKNPPFPFVPVTGITGLPIVVSVGTPMALTGRVNPYYATNKSIVWSVSDAGTTGATISGNTLSTTGEGKVTVTATIADGLGEGVDYTQSFDIAVRWLTVIEVSNAAELSAAFTSLIDGDTIKLLSDIEYGSISIKDMRLTFDVNGHILNVYSDRGRALEVMDNGEVNLIDSGTGGEFNVTGGSSANPVWVEYGGKATVTNVTSVDGIRTVTATNDSTVTVLGDAISTGYAYGIDVSQGSDVTVHGNVIVDSGMAIHCRRQSSLTIYGNVTVLNGDAIYAGDNAIVIVHGDVSAAGTKNVSVFAHGGATAIVHGSVAFYGSFGAAVDAWDGTITVNGDVNAIGTGSVGAWARVGSAGFWSREDPSGGAGRGGEIVVNGKLNAPVYFRIGNINIASADAETESAMPGYLEYKDDVNTIWVWDFGSPLVGSITTPVWIENEPCVLTAPQIIEGKTPTATHGWQISYDSDSWIELVPSTLATMSYNGQSLRYYATNSHGTCYSNTLEITVISSFARFIVIEMWDSYGDGWDGGAALRINVNGADLSPNARVNSGGRDFPEYYRFEVNPGDDVSIYWISGSYQVEDAFAVYYEDDPPDPAFSPDSERWSKDEHDPGGKVLVFMQYEAMSSIPNNALLASFVVGAVGTVEPCEKVQAKDISLTGSGGSNALYVTDTNCVITFNGSWPGIGWEAVSIGLFPADTELTESGINQAYIGLVSSEPALHEDGTTLLIPGVDLTSNWNSLLAPGDYRVVVYALAPGGDWDEFIFYSADVFTITGAPVHVHDYTKVVTDPTCLEQGYTTYICDCGESYYDDYTAALGHDWVFEGHDDASCTEDGYDYYMCSRCGWTKTEVIPAFSHDWGVGVVSPPTCTEQGYTTYTCSKCGETKVEDYTAALDHDWDDGVVTKQPTETEEGEMTYTCKRCLETRTSPIPVLAHTHTYATTATDPTCTEQGYTTYACSCGDSYVADYTAALGHDFTIPAGHKDATCEESGYNVWGCSRCDAADTVIIPALGHDWGVGVVTLPTCTEQGYTTYTCSKCNEIKIEDYTAALDHNFSMLLDHKDATDTEDGYDIWKCTRCDETKTVLIPKTGGKIIVSAVTTAKDFISMVETAKNSRIWVLTFNVTLTYSDGTKEVVRYSISLNGNNANQDGKYKFADGHDLAGYTLVYDIKGNGSNIKDFKLIRN